jgi:hypothetical protein
MSILDYRRTSCNNCGHPSHCGVAIHKQVNGNSPIFNHRTSSSYEVCRSCICDECNKINNENKEKV